jgi:hypothetical protein
LDSKRQQLGDPQAKAGVRDHHCLAPRWHGLSQGLHLRHGQRDDSLSSDRGRVNRLTGLDATSRSWTAAAKMDRRSATRSRSVPGERSWDRSLTQACTCEARTAASRMEPILVPSMCLLIREATRVAVVGRWDASLPIGGRTHPL